MKTNAELAKALIDNAAFLLNEAKEELSRAGGKMKGAQWAEEDYKKENGPFLGMYVNPFADDYNHARDQVEKARVRVEDTQAMYDFVVNRICALIKE